MAAYILLLLVLSISANAEILTAVDTNVGPVNEHPYLDNYSQHPCVGSMCQIKRAFSVPATGLTQHVMLTVSLQQSAFIEPDLAYEAMSLYHNGYEVLLVPGTRAPLSGLPITITFDDGAPARPLLGFQASGTYRPTEGPMSKFENTAAAGPWILTVVAYHEEAGWTNYLGATLDVWADRAPFVEPQVAVPEPVTWAMMLAGLGLLWIGRRK